MYPTIGVVLLAAGKSERMGAPNKLLLPVGGEPMIRRAARLYCELGMRVTMVVGHQGSAIKRAVEGLPVSIIENKDYKVGQASSVRFGLNNCPIPEDGLLIALGDQPLLEADDISSYCDNFLDSAMDKIFIPAYHGVRGNPVLIPRAIMIHLREIDTKTSVRRYIDTHEHKSNFHAVSTPHFTTDLDTPEDYDCLRPILNADGNSAV